MEISSERVENEDEYMVRVDKINNRYTRTTTYAKSESHTKQWVQHIQRIYRLKLCRGNLVVSLSADRTFNYAKGRSLLSKAKVAKKMEKDHGWLMPKLVELRELAAQRNNVIGFSHCSLAKLAWVVLGEEHNHVKPRMITTTWSDSPWHVFDRRRCLPTT